MKIGIIVQTRMGSSRLPGKVMMKADETDLMLDYSIKQISHCKKCDYIIIATTDLKQDDVIINHCENLNVKTFRGSENDVLDRHYRCAQLFGLSHIVRIPSDKPLIDPQIIDSAIENCISNNYDYVANFVIKKHNGDFVINSTYPSGTEVEVLSSHALETAWKESSTPEEREHVTPYIYLNPKKFKINYLEYHTNLSHLRWSLDYESDLKFIREIIKKIKNRPILMNDVVNVVKDNPDMINLNNKNKRVTKN